MIRYLWKQLTTFLINMYKSSGISGARPNTKNLSVSLQTKQRQFLYSATDTLPNGKGIAVDLRFHTG